MNLIFNIKLRHRRNLIIECSKWGSNPRPLAHKTNALPVELPERKLINKKSLLDFLLIIYN